MAARPGRRPRGRALAAGAALALGLSMNAPSACAAVLDGLYSLLHRDGHSVRITRTGHDVVHIEGDDDESVGYGMGYAYAQDHLCAMADLLATVRGERSRWFGAETSGVIGTRTLPNHVIDVFVRGQMDDPKIAYAWRTASPAARDRVQGYVDGYNRYLHDARYALPEACDGAPWIAPMTLEEFRRLGELTQVEAGLAAWADAVVGAQPPRPDGTPQRPAWLPAPPVADARDTARAGPLAGSNAFAFGREASLDGRGLLLANPHLPWTGLNRFWQVHLTIPGQLDVMGAALGPVPWISVGFNASVAWTHTVSPAHRFVLRELALVPGTPTSYLVDGKPEPMGNRTVRLAERSADGGTRSTQQTLWNSRYGPIVVAPMLGIAWNGAVAYALQDANTLSAAQADTWMAIDRAGGVAEIRAALARQGTPWMSTVAADRDGAVLFADGSGVPNVDAALLAACTPSLAGASAANRFGLLVLDGSRSACDPPGDPAAARPGILGPARLPWLQRDDWVQSSGDTGWLANPAAPLTGFAPPLGPARTAQPLATRSALRDITARLESRDGRARHARMGEDDLAAMFFSNANHAANLVLDDLLAACPGAPSEASRTGCAALALWDRTDNAEARGAPVFREFWRRVRGLPGLWRVPFDPDDPIYTPIGLDMARPATRQEVFDALGQGVGALRQAGFAAGATLGELQVVRTAGKGVPLGGGEGFEGVLNVLGSTDVTPLTRQGYGVDRGTSYLQLVDFGADGPRAKALLVYGQSSNDGSPFEFDQLPAYAARRWFELPFKREDVARQRVGEVLTLRFQSAPAP